MKLLVPVFSLTLFLSAFLLFGVQPMFSKMVLPYLGGSPMVWNTAMLFFQAVLLAGYGYAYFNSKIKNVSIQLAIHAGIFLLFLAFLPFTISSSDIPKDINNPTLWQIGLMLSTIGPPFFILSGCAPLLQRWFSLSKHENAENPYFLYAASNIGSMLALLTYPVITEPLFGATQQVYIWSALYGVLIAMIVFCGLLVIKNKKSAENILEMNKHVALLSEKPTWTQRAIWLVLAFIPSSLMLGVTTFMTTDIASVPLLWIIPLSIYVGTFIIAFANKRPFKTSTIAGWHSAIFIIMALVIFNPLQIPTEFKFFFHIFLFSIVALSCHMRLVDYKPHSEYLTEFYFIMSFGGVLGGIFNALLAPVLFTNIWEYTIILALSVFFINPAEIKQEIVKRNFFKGVNFYKVMPIIFSACLAGIYFLGGGEQPDQHKFIINASVILLCAVLALCYNLRFLFACMIALMLLVFPVHVFEHVERDTKNIFTKRNFFGTTRVLEGDDMRIMMHGTTLHGLQFLDKERRMQTTGYYNKETALGEAFTYFSKDDIKHKVAILGLGTGGLACFTAPGREFEFYEIDPDIADLSEKYHYFSYLEDCGNPYKIIIGDARLKVEDVPDGYYDLITVDAFSSDNIPVHLVTKEAIALYVQKLSEDGALIIHISNRHIDLRPVIATIANDLGFSMLERVTSAGDEKTEKELIFDTRAVAVSRKPETIAPLKERGWKEYNEISPVFLWTDEYANIINVLRFLRHSGDQDEDIKSQVKE